MSQQTRQHIDWSCTPKCKLETGIKIIKTKKGEKKLSEAFPKTETNETLTYTYQKRVTGLKK